MRLELPGLRNRREILAAPELLRITAEGMKLSVITKSLLAFVLILLYSMFMYGSIRTIITKPIHNKETFIMSFVFLAIFLSIAVAILIRLIFKDERMSLIFTEVGMAGTGLFNVKYDRIGTYGWEICNGILATGQASKKENKKTLRITANKGLFPELAYKDRFGNSILGSYGYLFDSNQINKTEEIMNSFGIKKMPDKT